MKVVAWVSRHPPLKSQIETLKEKLGEDIEIVRIDKTFTDANEVYKQVKTMRATHAVVVLPLSMVAVLTQRKDITWLWAEMISVHPHSCPGASKCKDYNPETDVVLESPTFNRHLRFKSFKRIMRVEMITEPF